MKIVNINSPAGQKFAAAVVTKTFRDKYNLHVESKSRGLAEEARRYNMTPKELIQFLRDTLPILVEDYLNEVEKVFIGNTAP